MVCYILHLYLEFLNSFEGHRHNSKIIFRKISVQNFILEDFKGRIYYLNKRISEIELREVRHVNLYFLIIKYFNINFN